MISRKWCWAGALICAIVLGKLLYEPHMQTVYQQQNLANRRAK